MDALFLAALIRSIGGNHKYRMFLFENANEITHQAFDAAPPRRIVPGDDKNPRAHADYFFNVQ
jgi:hypothetical protein